jgi:tetratricopeptide (TPR) repeat protein
MRVDSAAPRPSGRSPRGRRPAPPRGAGASRRHLTVDELLRAADAVLSDRSGHSPHLLDCAPCRGRLRRILTELAPDAPPPPKPPVARTPEGVFSRLGGGYLAEVASGAREAPALADELLAGRWSKARLLFAGLQPGQAVAAVLHLHDRAFAAAEDSPREGQRLATFALRLTAQLDREGLPPATRQDLTARGRLLLGYAAGLAGRPGEDFRRPFQLAEARIAHPDDPEAAVLCRLLGSVLDRRGRAIQALAFLERAERLFRDAGEVLEQAHALSQQAVVYAQAGDTGRALALLGRALALQGPWLNVEEALRSRLVLAVLHAVVGHPRVASELLAAAEEEARALGVELPALFALARARLAAERRDRGAAERLLGEALASALTTGAHGEGAAAAFHLAALRAGSGRSAGLTALAEDVRRLAAPGPLPDELRALLRRLGDLLRSGEATRERILALQRRFRNRLPRAPWPLPGLAVLFGEELTEWLSAPHAGAGAGRGSRRPPARPPARYLAARQPPEPPASARGLAPPGRDDPPEEP